MQLLFLQQWFSEEILKAIGWTLIHSLWQGLLAAVLAGIIIICTKRTEARHRYNLLGVVLFLFIVATVITFSQQIKGSVAAERPFDGLAVSVTDNSFIADNYKVTPVPGKMTLARFVTYFNANADLFVLIWAIFFLFHCIKLFTGLAGIQRIRNYKIHKSPAEWLTKMDQLCKILCVKKTVGLLQSELVKVPVAIGFFKPVILVPLGLLSNLPPEQVETILLHELAHIRRKDYLFNILQRFIEAVFFFNPALLWISSLARQEREACCDDIVVANTTDKGSYLEALVSFQEYSLAAPGYAMAIRSKQHYLLNRVKRLITRENKKLDVMEKIFLVMGLVAMTAFTFIPKKDAANKKNLSVTTTLKEPAVVESFQAKPAVLSGTPKPRKADVKKENKKPTIEVPRNILPADTVPSSKKEKTGYSDQKFSSVSSTVNDDGTTRTETTTVIDQDGKKYTYTKLNNKITRLSIDGKAVPENEIGNYSPLFDKIEMTIRENNVKRLLNMERRKTERAERNEDMNNRMAERKLSREYQNAQKQYLPGQNKQSGLLEKSRKTLESQRKETIKLLEKLKERRINVPMINGREVIKNDNHVQNSIAAGIPVKADIKNKPAKLFQKIENLKKPTQDTKTAGEALSLESHADIALKFQLNTHVNNDLLKGFDYKPSIDEWKISPKTNITKPAVPVKLKYAPGVKPVEGAQPEKPKPIREGVRRRVIT